MRLLLVALLFALPAASRDSQQPELLVFAAASLTTALEELASTWQTRSRTPVRFSFAASSVLARQIEAGSPAQVFVSADQQWMDYLASRRMIDQTSRRDLVRNRLVLIAPTDSRIELRIAPGFPLAQALGGGRLSTGDPDNVPVGRYARSALSALGVWDQVAGKLIRAENVRAALTYVARGEAPLGIVYATDAQIEPKVRVLATFPDNTHAPITYPAAATARAGAEAAAFLAFLSSDEATPIWRKYGFLEIE